ncbi:MFS transporter [Citricoccus muralis]|uniref:DHA2 family multidrug resistance protein-like MFS transporter n=1 Tax=Citricoccus muralis TaxID=169134 RepID=A0A3D9L830_9MICC|nr:DHA2 family multidrug resistance protein-like MFS transporter [Citricoccus muralis]
MTTSSTPAEMTPLRRWLLLVAVSAGVLLITLDNTILYTALPTLTAELGATASESLWIINAYPLVMCGLLLGAGTLGDRYGHRRLFLIGLVLFGAASLVAAFAPGVTVLIASRALLAVGAACMMPATLALIRIGFDDVRQRNVAIGVWGSISVVGAALGPIVGGLLLEHFWWGSVFLINVPVVLGALALTPWVAPRARPDRSKSWDALSSLHAMVALTGAVFAIKEATGPDPSGPLLTVTAACAVAGAWLFVRRQHRLDDPVLDFAVFRNRAFSAGFLAAACSMFVIGGVQLVTTQRFQLVEGYTPLQSGLLVAALAAGSLLTSLAGGATLHVLGLRTLITGGFILGTLGMTLATLGATTHLGLLVTGLVLTGAGMGAAMSVASTAIIGNVPARQAGMASSVEEVSYEFGNLLAVAILGSLATLVYTVTVQLPAGAPAGAADSMSQAVTVAPGDPAVLAAAGAAYDTAFVTVLAIITAVVAVCAVATGWLLRHYGPGTPASAYESNH